MRGRNRQKEHSFVHIRRENSQCWPLMRIAVFNMQEEKLEARTRVAKHAEDEVPLAEPPKFRCPTFSSNTTQN